MEHGKAGIRLRYQLAIDTFRHVVGEQRGIEGALEIASLGVELLPPITWVVRIWPIIAFGLLVGVVVGVEDELAVGTVGDLKAVFRIALQIETA